LVDWGSHRHSLIDAAHVVRRLWRPMAAWSLLVWAAGLLLLSPLTAFVLGRLLGTDGVISNEEVVSWLITPRGVAFLLWALASALTLSVAQFGGLFRLITSDRARSATLSRAVLALTTGLPSVFRFCLATVAAALAVLAPLLLWTAFLYARFLRDHDINYYLSARPPALYTALALAAPVVVAWGVVVVWLLVRILPALPAFFDGHRPARTAAAFAWRVSRRRFWTLLTRLGAAVLVIGAARAVLAGTLFFLASSLVDRIAAASTSLRPVITATAVAGAIGGAIDVIVTFLGFAWLSVLLTRFYTEEVGEPSTSLATGHSPALPPLWLTGRRVAVIVASALAMNGAATLSTLEAVSKPPDFLVIAHRAGAHYAPENTLLALERAIEARADLAEIDVQRTKDGVVVVVHDADLMRLARDPRKIAATDYAAFAGVRLGPSTTLGPGPSTALRPGSGDESAADERRLARLDEFLDRANGRIRLAIELKYYEWDPLLAPQVLAEIRARGVEPQIMIISLSLQAIEQVRSLAPDIPTGYLSSVSVGSLTGLPVTALALSRQRSTAQTISDAHARGLQVYVWTVNDAAGMVEMVGRDADGIITDDPIVAARVRDELKSLTSTELLLLRFSDALTDEEERDEVPTVQ
jgi:glycerophosphoryl diester phosphodiesterase